MRKGAARDTERWRVARTRPGLPAVCRANSPPIRAISRAGTEVISCAYAGLQGCEASS